MDTDNSLGVMNAVYDCSRHVHEQREFKQLATQVYVVETGMCSAAK